MGDIARAYAGAALKTTIAAGITGTPVSVTIFDVTGWPIGAPFTVTVDPGLSTEEKILGTRSGNTFTITARGYDGTTSQNHAANCEVYPVALTAVEATATNRLTSALTTQGDLIVADASGNPVRLARGTAGQVLEAGASTLAWGQVDTAGIADLAVTAAKIANDTITATQIAANAIGSSELADNAVDTAALAANAVTLAKIASEAWTDYTPQIDQGATTNIAKTVTYARYIKSGRMVTVGLNLALTAGGTAGAAFTVTTPVAASASIGSLLPAGSGYFFRSSSGVVYPMLVVFSTSTVVYFWQTANSNADVDAGLGADSTFAGALASGDQIRCTFTYEAAA